MSCHASGAFQAHLASIMELLANTAVAEICRLVEQGFTALRLELCHRQREVDGLRRRLLLARVRSSRRIPPKSPLPARARSSRRRPPGASGGQRDGGAGAGRGGAAVIKVESGGLEDVHPSGVQDGKTNTLPSPEPACGSVGAEPGFQTQDPDPDQSFLPGHAPGDGGLPCWQRIHGVSNGDATFAVTTGSRPNDDAASAESFQGAGADRGQRRGRPQDPLRGKRAGDAPRDPSPGGGGGGRAPSHGAGGALGNVLSALAVSLDWEPQGAASDSVLIKVEEEVSGGWAGPGQGKEPDHSGRRERQRGAESRGGGGGRRGVEGGGAAAAAEDPDASPPWSQRSSGNFKTLPPVFGFSSSSSFPGLLRGGPRFRLEADGAHLPPPPRALFAAVAPSPPPPSAAGAPPAPPPLWPGPGAGGAFRCEACGKAFAKFPSLRRHRRVHTGEKPFGCRHCAKRFSHGHQMKNHERVHTGEKPFPCPVCGRRFVQSNHLKRHLQVHRQDAP